jgi:hypothetical protein
MRDVGWPELLRREPTAIPASRMAGQDERPHSRPGQHRTLFYGEYANRVRGERHTPEAEECPAAAEPPRKRCSPSWARLIAKVYQVDPLLCTRCGQRMSIVAFLTDAFAIRKILDHLGLSTPEAEKPPPQREVLRVAEHGEGWGVPAEWSDPNPSLTVPARAA